MQAKSVTLGLNSGWGYFLLEDFDSGPSLLKIFSTNIHVSNRIIEKRAKVVKFTIIYKYKHTDWGKTPMITFEQWRASEVTGPLVDHVETGTRQLAKCSLVDHVETRTRQLAKCSLVDHKNTAVQKMFTCRSHWKKNTAVSKMFTCRSSLNLNTVFRKMFTCRSSWNLNTIFRKMFTCRSRWNRNTAVRKMFSC